VCEGALVKWGVKVSEVTSCKAIINIKRTEAFKCLTLHDLIYNDIFIVSTFWCTYCAYIKYVRLKILLITTPHNYSFYNYFLNYVSVCMYYLHLSIF
jgi:hypothetical protein